MQSASMSNINQIYEKYSNSKISANIKYDTSTIEKEDIISFIKILDYLYCTYDLDKFSHIMSSFYKSADDIFNSFET